jgi:hypothetical protein
MPENETQWRNREREFQKAVLAALSKPKENGLWALLNRPFTLWLLSLILLTIGGSYLTAHRQCQEDADKQIDQLEELDTEIERREQHIREIVEQNASIAAIRA